MKNIAEEIGYTLPIRIHRVAPALLMLLSSSLTAFRTA